MLKESPIFNEAICYVSVILKFIKELTLSMFSVCDSLNDECVMYVVVNEPCDC